MKSPVLFTYVRSPGHAVCLIMRKSGSRTSTCDPKVLASWVLGHRFRRPDRGYETKFCMLIFVTVMIPVFSDTFSSNVNSLRTASYGKTRGIFNEQDYYWVNALTDIVNEWSQTIFHGIRDWLDWMAVMFSDPDSNVCIIRATTPSATISLENHRFITVT